MFGNKKIQFVSQHLSWNDPALLFFHCFGFATTLMFLFLSVVFVFVIVSIVEKVPERIEESKNDVEIEEYVSKFF